MENCPFIDDFPIETSIYKGFSMVMLNNQRVYIEPVTNCDDHKYLSGGPIPNMGQSVCHFENSADHSSNITFQHVRFYIILQLYETMK